MQCIDALGSSRTHLAVQVAGHDPEVTKAAISEASVFLLFWTRNSMHSLEVRQEWEYALSLNRPRFIRPVYFERPVPGIPIPEELAVNYFTFVPIPVQK